ncbi:SH3 domain-binding protein 5-like [Centropristis striata]|uniref:SH3 domain-binding protein 5-like n=1 Tax=Centropristis striata TaxID=184440 RepID=UPI0027E1CAD8|nr:SH3 domain-binding protein 5-like [Centropristis striata]
MEHHTSREIASGARLPAAAGEREETPGEEATGAEGSTGMLRRRGEDGGTAEEEEEEEAQCGDEPEDQITIRGEGDAGKHEEELDPRIQECYKYIIIIELEQLNQASDEINKLELQLDDARSSYRRILTDSARKLNAQGSQLGACIEKARPYYEARRLAKEAQQETQKAALRYERAVSMHTAAREMVYVAEQGLLADRNTMDPTWQEMLNHATAKVNEAEEERLRSEREHQHVTQLCQEAEARVQTLQKALKKVILKSKPYFELKAQFNHILEEHKSRVVQLEERVAKVKTRYSVALRNLEQISEQIHAQRGRIRASRGCPAVCGGRSSPVGAEAEVRATVGINIGSSLRSSCAGVGGIESNWVDSEKTRLWVERHRESGWGQRDQLEVEQAGSDCMSVISLQTIASDLEKCDSVEHLGDLSDTGSVLGQEWERGRKANERPVSKEVVTEGPQQKRAHQEKAAVTKEKQESFIKQHHRSVSL